MGKPTGFMEVPRRDRVYTPVEERVSHFKEFVVPLADDDLMGITPKMLYDAAVQGDEGALAVPDGATPVPSRREPPAGDARVGKA